MPLDPEKLLSSFLSYFNRLVKHPELSDDNLLYWRERILFAIYTTFVLLGFIVYCPSVYLAAKHGVWLIVLVNTFAYVSLLTIYFLKKLSFHFRAIYILAIFYIIGISLMITISAEYALIWLFIAAIATSVLLGLRASCIALAINLTVLVVAGFFIREGVALWDSHTPNNIAGWIIVSFNFMLVNSIGTVSIAVLVEKLKQTIEQEKDVSQRLLEQFDVLKQETEQRKKVEKEKELMSKQLRQSEKMEALGTLAGGIAHDFNNILNIIFGYTDLAKIDAPADSKYEQDLDRILIAGHRAKDLVSQILAFSRQVQVEKIPILVQPLIKEALKMVRSSIPATIEINGEISSDCGAVEVDPTQLHQILINLCVNASHAMEEKGGTLKVDLKIADSVPFELMENSEFENDGFVELSISDTGTGIGPDIIDNIFDPFFTTKKKGKGTGMGLAVSYSIVKEYGGTITVDSKVGSGTVFHVYLPQSKQQIQSYPSETNTFIEQGTERILFIDDEEILTELGKEMLGRLGYHVTPMLKSSEALELFRSQADAFDLVITDQDMPELTGLEMAKKMLLIRPDIPIILLTGFSNLVNEEVARDQGIKCLAYKPISRNAIAKLIREVLDAP